MNEIIKSSYDANDQISKKKPLMIGCSGGGGHIAAIQGVRGYFERIFKKDIDLPDYAPILFDKKPSSNSRDQIATGINVMHAPIIGNPIRAAISLSHIPVLPNRESLEAEVSSLSKNNSSKRKYIDMLLDVYPAGYESAAIWNVLQRNDKTAELKKLIQLQHSSDAANYAVVYDYYLNALKKSAEKGEPFTEIISTQAMALPALCDAVKDYNFWISQEQIKVPAVVIHQYLTDLPTKGAVHFFNPLSTLSSEQQSQMKLYGVGMQADIINHFFPEGQNFAGIFDIPAQENPMVREGFKNPELNNSESFEKEITLTLLGEESSTIKPNEKIASVMLGSQAGNDTYEYIETLLENGMDKVFVFGGKTNATLKAKIENLLMQHPEYQGRIIPLGNQGDVHITPLMTRSNVLVIRGGGLSVMEQLAMKHNPQQTVLIHHANSSKKELSSGISWEDENVETLIKDLKSKGVHSLKTSPERANRHLGEARLIAAVKKYGKDVEPEDASQHIQNLSSENLDVVLNALIGSEKLPTPTLPEELISYFNHREQEANRYVSFIEGRLTKIISHLSTIINGEANSLTNKEQYLEIDEITNVISSLDKYDVEKIVGAYDNGSLENPSSTLVSAVQAYQAFTQLKDILTMKSEGNTLSANQRLTQFKEKYEASIDKLSLPNNNIITKLVEKIYYTLAQYFPYFEKKLTPEQEVKKSVLQSGNHSFFKLDDSGKAQSDVGVTAANLTEPDLAINFQNQPKLK